MSSRDSAIKVKDDVFQGVPGHRFSKFKNSKSKEFRMFASDPSQLDDSHFTSFPPLPGMTHLKVPSHWIPEQLSMHGTRSKPLAMKDDSLGPRRQTGGS